MYRFSNSFTREMLMLLVSLRDHKIDPQEALKTCEKYLTEDGEVPEGADKNEQAIARVVRNFTQFGVPLQTLDEMIELVCSQLNGKEGGAQLLVDKLAEVVMGPFPGNQFGPPIVKSVQRAILNPEELDGVMERIIRKEMYCCGCGHMFGDGQMVTFGISTNNRHERTSGLYCHTCKMPSQMRCETPKCTHNQSVIKKILNLMYKNGACQACRDRKAKGETGPPPPEEEHFDPIVPTGVLDEEAPFEYRVDTPRRVERNTPGAWNTGRAGIATGDRTRGLRVTDRLWQGNAGRPADVPPAGYDPEAAMRHLNDLIGRTDVAATAIDRGIENAVFNGGQYTFEQPNRLGVITDIAPNIDVINTTNANLIQGTVITVPLNYVRNGGQQ